MNKSQKRAIETKPVGSNETKELSRDRIAARAYDKWQQRGCPLWDGEQDWFAAQDELEHPNAVTTDRRAVRPVA